MSTPESQIKATNIVWHGTSVSKLERSSLKNQKPVIFGLQALVAVVSQPLPMP